jgi:Brp/Blh family beta-carotene 15,15'-monooxygenase
MSWEVLIPMLMVLLVGFPHGAADGVLAVNLARRGTIGLGAFFTLYGVITLSAAAFWLWLPVLSLIGFLLLSVFHFGTLDSGNDRLVGRRTLRTLVHGSTLICIIPWAHEREVTEIFGLLIGSEVVWLVQILAAAALAWAIGVVWLGLAFGPAGQRAAGELIVVAAVLIILPPLWGFALYFCTVHSWRHMNAIVATLAPFGPAAFRLVALLTLVSFLLVIAGALVLPAVDIDSGVIRATFISLAALTVPHFLLIDVYRVLPRLSAAGR